MPPNPRVNELVLGEERRRVKRFGRGRSSDEREDRFREVSHLGRRRVVVGVEFGRPGLRGEAIVKVGDEKLADLGPLERPFVQPRRSAFTERDLSGIDEVLVASPLTSRIVVEVVDSLRLQPQRRVVEADVDSAYEGISGGLGEGVELDAPVLLIGKRPNVDRFEGDDELAVLHLQERSLRMLLDRIRWRSRPRGRVVRRCGREPKDRSGSAKRH